MQNIDIQLKPSKIAIFLILFLWVGSILAVMSLHMAIWITILLFFVISWYGAKIFFTHGLFIGPKALRGLRQISDKDWLIIMNKNEYPAILMGDSTVTSKFCVLRFQIPGKKLKYSCLIFDDSLEFDMYRRLLLHLRCIKSI